MASMYEIKQTLVFQVMANSKQEALEEFGEYDNSMARSNDVEVREVK